MDLIVFLKSSGKAHTCQEISKALYVSADKSVETALRVFEKAGLLKSNHVPQKEYMYAPTNRELQDAAELAVKAYGERRVQVVNLIHATPVRCLSDAFKVREDNY